MRDRASIAAVLISLVALAIAAAPWLSHRVPAMLSRLAEHPMDRPIRQLAATPERFDAALVFLVGFCQNSFEHVAIHEFPEGSPWHGSIWLDLSPEQAEVIHAPTPRPCRVTGVFRAGPTGHLGSSVGRISPVTEIAFYPERDAA